MWIGVGRLEQLLFSVDDYCKNFLQSASHFVRKASRSKSTGLLSYLYNKMSGGIAQLVAVGAHLDF